METERYHHKSEKDQIGTIWVPRENEPQISREHTCTVGELLSDSHYDVFVKYGYARKIASGVLDEEYNFWTDFYDKMQIKRAGFSHREGFDKMIQEFAQNGFDPAHPIPIDENYNFFDGSHRVACAALFDARPKVAIYKASAHSYDRQWFQDNNFTNEQLERVDEIKKQLFDKYQAEKTDEQVAIVWGAALDHWEPIIQSIQSGELRRAFIKDFKGDIKKFIIDSYEIDGMAPERIVSKADKLSAVDSQVGIIVVNTPFSSVDVLKHDIRSKVMPNMKDYFFDNIIHVIDNKSIGKKLLTKYNLGPKI
ncbi:MAG: hypothetical protein ABIJ81_02760 [Patescibacteria group bacterium]